MARILEQFGEPTGGSPKGVAVRLEHGAEDLAGIVRALDAEGIELEHLELHAPSLDDVFLAKTGRSLEGSGDEDEDEAGPRLDERPAQVGHIGRRAVVRTMRQPANVVFPFVFPMALLAVTSAGLNAATKIPGFPTDSFLAFFLAFPFIQGALFATMNAGTDLARDIQSGFLNRLALTPMRGGALIGGQLAGIALMGFVQAVSTSRRVRVRRPPRNRRRPARSSCSFSRPRSPSPSAPWAPSSPCAPDRERRCRGSSRSCSSACSSPR